MAATPVKTLTRLQLTPTTKQYVCIIYGENIHNKNYILKLFHKNIKNISLSSIGETFERFSISVDQHNHVCRSCIRKLTSLENKVSELKRNSMLLLKGYNPLMAGNLGNGC